MKKLNLATVNKSEVNVGSVVNTKISNDGDFLIKVARFLLDYLDHFLVDVGWILPFICYVKDAHFDGNILYITNYNGEEYYLDGDIDYDEDDSDSDNDSSEVYSQTWQNTGMKDQPIYYFHTRSKDGHLGDAIGMIMIEIPNLKDTTFYVVEHSDSATLEVEFEHGDSDNPYRYEYEFSRNLEECRDLLDEVIDTICDIQNYGRGAIYSNSEEVINCIKDISDKLHLGYVFEERYCEEEMSEYMGVYSADMASKMYLGKNVDFAFRLDVAQSMVAENENAHCDFQLHDVIMEYPNGDLDRDMGYVIFFNTEE